MKLFNRRLLLVSIITGVTLISTSISTFAADNLILTKDIVLNSNISEITLDANVGTVELSESQDNSIHIYVKVSDKDGWSLFESSPVDAELVIDNNDDQIKVSLANDDHSEHWKVAVPPLENIDINLGVGDMTIKDVTSNLSVNVGVGDVKVNSPENAYSTIEIEVGVGNGTIKSNVGQLKKSNEFISTKMTWIGVGEYKISVEIGVGEASIKLI